MSAIAVPVSRGLSTILPQIGKFFSNLGKNITPVASQVTKKASVPASTITRNIAITSGGIFGTTLASSLFLSSPQGQNTLQSLDKITDLGGNITDFFNKNPIVPIGLLILGGLIVVSVIKK